MFLRHRHVFWSLCLIFFFSSDATNDVSLTGFNLRIALSTGCRLWTCQTSKWHSHSCIHSSHGDIWVGLNIWNTLALLQCWSILWVCSISFSSYNSWVQFQRKLVEVLKMANTSNSHDMWLCETEVGFRTFSYCPVALHHILRNRT